MNGLEMRIGRHLKQHKKFHWHIDYLREKARIIDVMLIPAEKKYECDLATALGKDLTCIRSFGSSDCQCPGHLFFADNEKDIVKAVHAKLSEIGLTYWPLYSKDSLGL
ncbi:MAG: DUF123 domain-containing protein [Dehalococcoidales bacterium]|nr:DUF123 domain-containing protein [Dehalococcoidales bacterium]